MNVTSKHIIALFLLLIFVCNGAVVLCVNYSKEAAFERIAAAESESSEKAGEERPSEKEFIAACDIFTNTPHPLNTFQSWLTRYKVFLPGVFLSVFTPPPELG